MNRREALRTAAFAGLAVATLGLAPRSASMYAPAAPVGLPNRLLRGASDGRILESLDAGASWQCVARLGEHCAVREIVARGDLFYATIETRGGHFVLRSGDARTWRTLGALESAL